MPQEDLKTRWSDKVTNEDITFAMDRPQPSKRQNLTLNPQKKSNKGRPRNTWL
ncbi:hypothetical protein DPMN_144766 [Dreissena polymorpha]|uniref:Uncharacterized protein n=1 Tax=Dreissena polymorpha TaxID=45954 RepID=A0A9D4J0K9_DREPO|nr:hypothetical protein DPMN_144766 [Dreissena polymorpha]